MKPVSHHRAARCARRYVPGIFESGSASHLRRAKLEAAANA